MEYLEGGPSWIAARATFVNSVRIGVCALPPQDESPRVPKERCDPKEPEPEFSQESSAIRNVGAGGPGGGPGLLKANDPEGPGGFGVGLLDDPEPPASHTSYPKP